MGGEGLVALSKRRQAVVTRRHGVVEREVLTCANLSSWATTLAPTDGHSRSSPTHTKAAVCCVRPFGSARKTHSARSTAATRAGGTRAAARPTALFPFGSSMGGGGGTGALGIADDEEGAGG